MAIREIDSTRLLMMELAHEGLREKQPWPANVSGRKQLYRNYFPRAVVKSGSGSYWPLGSRHCLDLNLCTLKWRPTSTVRSQLIPTSYARLACKIQVLARISRSRQGVVRHFCSFCRSGCLRNQHRTDIPRACHGVAEIQFYRDRCPVTQKRSKNEKCPRNIFDGKYNRGLIGSSW